MEQEYGFNPRTRTGCDLEITLRDEASIQFQSTHPHGVRPELQQKAQEYLVVSIHAPARGATSLATSARSQPSRFNPRTRTGCDQAALTEAEYQAAFQSTHPHGVRPAVGIGETVVELGFNPRTRTGCDL